MNTLVSWIDADAVSGMARDMASEPTEAVTWVAGPGEATPVTRLIADDFRLPEHFAPEPFPAPGPALPPEERSKVRHFLEEIRQKAEHSGLIPRPAEPVPSPERTDSAVGSPALPPLGQAEQTAVAHAPPSSSPVPVPVPVPATTPVHSPLPQPAVAPVSFRGAPFSKPPGAASPASAPPSGTSPSPVLHLPPLATTSAGPAASPVPSSPAGASEEISSVPPLRRHIPHFEVPLGPLATRVRALSDWIRRQIETNDIFILDTNGCPVGDREAVPEIVASAVVLAEAARRAAAHLPDAPTGALYLDLEDERRLCVISTATTHGNFTLGLILPDALIPRAADRLRRALKRTVEADAPAPLRLPPRERW